jgi:hypothetical protein
MLVVTVSIIIAIPAGLHAYLIGIVRFQLKVVDWTVNPHICRVTVCSLFDSVVLVQVFRYG